MNMILCTQPIQVTVSIASEYRDPIINTIPEACDSSQSSRSEKKLCMTWSIYSFHFYLFLPTLTPSTASIGYHSALAFNTGLSRSKSYLSVGRGGEYGPDGILAFRLKDLSSKGG
ncbi:hypothetical protein F5I97DRAFT_1927608 [Phlebopus sp. FC_14]|nr:hypothetical protein F5I97DRAFT_1927608 [Phlebopus sp. FC_14]